ATGAFALIAAALSAALVHLLVPMARFELLSRNAEIAENISARLLVEGVFQHPAPGLTVYLREISADAELLDVFLADGRNPDAHVIYTARRAFLVRTDDGPQLVMFDGLVQRLTSAKQMLATTRFDTFVADLDEFEFVSGPDSATPRETTSFALLQRISDNPTRELLFEFHKRNGTALAVLSYVSLAFALMVTGRFSRFGLTPRIALSISALLLLHVAMRALEAQAATSREMLPLLYLGPTLGLGLSAAILLITDLPGRARTQEL
ncbi:MAG: LptF/LptG family permease, partial [Pseudomonadota bacterium]